MTISQKIWYKSQDLRHGEDLVRKAHQELFADSGKIEFLSSESDDTLLKIRNIANRINDDFDNLIVIGAGASINIPKMLVSLPHKSALNVQFLETMDHKLLDTIFSNYSADKTACLVISKSGETAEVMFLLSLCVCWLKKHLGKSRLKTHLYFVTEPTSRIAKFAEEIGAGFVAHPTKIVGRFSFFYATGLLPAAIAGFSIEQLVSSGRDSFAKFLSPNSWMLDGVIYNYSLKQSCKQAVLMYYDHAFDGTMLWWRQMIGESLGKNNKGITPLLSHGMIDRHSQLQLYLDGSSDQFFTIMSCQPTKLEKDPWEAINDPLIAELIDPKLVDLGIKYFNHIQEEAMIDTLSQHKKNVRQIITNSLQEDFIAEFVMAQMLEIVLYAYVEDINPFDQPAIERFKQNVQRKYRKNI